jgi:hypothetical protein
VKLSVLERLVLLSILPAEGDYLTVKTIRETRELVAFDTDAEQYGITTTPEGVKCDDFAAEKDIHLPPRVMPVIIAALADLNVRKALTDKHLSLYEKFIVE